LSSEFGHAQGIPNRTTSARVGRSARSARKRIFTTASELFYRRGIRAVGVETIVPRPIHQDEPVPASVQGTSWWPNGCAHHDIHFWQAWTDVAEVPSEPRQAAQTASPCWLSTFSDPQGARCPIANAAVEITEKTTRRKVDRVHRRSCAPGSAHLCARCRLGILDAADQLFLLMKARKSRPRLLERVVREGTSPRRRGADRPRTCALVIPAF